MTTNWVRQRKEWDESCCYYPVVLTDEFRKSLDDLMVSYEKSDNGEEILVRIRLLNEEEKTKDLNEQKEYLEKVTVLEKLKKELGR